MRDFPHSQNSVHHSSEGETVKPLQLFPPAAAAGVLVLMIINSVHAGSDVGLERAPGQPAYGSIFLGAGDGISVTVSGDFSLWSLDPRESLSIKPGTMIVDAPDESSNWTVVLSCDSPSGQLTEYNESQLIPDPRKIGSPLLVRADGGNTVDLSAGGELKSGQGDAAVSFSLEQRTSWYDQPLPSGRIYRMVVTFTGSIKP